MEYRRAHDIVKTYESIRELANTLANELFEQIPLNDTDSWDEDKFVDRAWEGMVLMKQHCNQLRKYMDPGFIESHIELTRKQFEEFEKKLEEDEADDRPLSEKNPGLWRLLNRKTVFDNE